jgi:hypothetical protein
LLLGLSASPAALGQHLFKCGATYQDRPCPADDVQKRFSHTAGSFSVGQVNAGTDKDCADAAAATFPFWQRMSSGEKFETLKAEVDAKPISREDKSRIRDALLALKEYKGSPKEVRSQLETQCMEFKRARGIPTERQVSAEAGVQSARSAAEHARTRAIEDRASLSAEMRARAEDERVARMNALRIRAVQEAAARKAAAAAAADRQQIAR